MHVLYVYVYISHICCVCLTLSLLTAYIRIPTAFNVNIYYFEITFYLMVMNEHENLEENGNILN